MASNFTLVGESPQVQLLREEIACAAKFDVRVLITGESGVGKEIVARLIHDGGPRARRPLLAVNCAGLADTLLESELFGHVRGSFTDAYRDTRGLLERAAGSTLFMDELAEMTLRMQSMLLRFVETGEIQPVGSDRVLPAKVDVRLVAATNRDLVGLVRDKAFRADLYYRLNVIHLRIPPLRERQDDITILLDHFLTRYARLYDAQPPELSPEAMSMLVNYDWPGNVRELMHLVEQLTVRFPGQRVTPLELPAQTGGMTSADAPSAAHRASEAQALFESIVRGGESFWSVVYEPFMMRDLTREHVRAIVRLGLEQTHGNYKALVPLLRMAGNDYKRFLNFLRKHNCQVPFKGPDAMPAGIELPADHQDHEGGASRVTDVRG